MLGIRGKKIREYHGIKKVVQSVNKCFGIIIAVLEILTECSEIHCKLFGVCQCE